MKSEKIEKQKLTDQDFDVMRLIYGLDIIDFEDGNLMESLGFPKLEVVGTNFKKQTALFLHGGDKANILCVAHRDTVNSSAHFFRENVFGKEIVWSPAHDDRLGVFTILHYLPTYYPDIKFHILLTDGEESGSSSAKSVKKSDLPKDISINWIVEFDRMGPLEEAVIYEYGHGGWKEVVAKYFPAVSRGSYTDICDMESWGVKAFNVGVGYQNNHALHSAADMYLYESQIERFGKFYSDNGETAFKHTPTYRSFSGTDGYYGKYLNSGYDKYNECYICKRRFGDGVGYNRQWLTSASAYLCVDCAKELMVYVEEMRKLKAEEAGDTIDFDVCLSCEKPFAESELHDGLCKSCEASYSKVGDDARLCRMCHGLFNKDDLQNGLCFDCAYGMYD